jgi:hypothetical protein
MGHRAGGIEFKGSRFQCSGRMEVSGYSVQVSELIISNFEMFLPYAPFLMLSSTGY